MRAFIIAIGVVAGVLAGCSQQSEPAAAGKMAVLPAGIKAALAVAPGLDRALSTVASAPDRGDFLSYRPSARLHQQGAFTWHAVELSEAHALRAIAEGGMVIPAPNGAPIRLAYERHIEHPDGSWTWIGRARGAKSSEEAVITFGAKAVYGTIPNGNEAPLQLTTAGNRTWLIQTDRRLQAQAEAATGASRDAAPDALIADSVDAPAGTRQIFAAASRKIAAAAPRPAAAGAVAVATVDVVVGYTNGFANRLGGRSQAVTRLQYLVDLTNQAYINSQVPGRIRMAAAIQVGYSDTTANRAALFELTGQSCSADNASTRRTPDNGESCSPASVPSALLPLIRARERYGADLVSLVRNYSQPENGSCGAAWLLGAEQTPITSADAQFGVSIISDSGGNMYPSQGGTCREDYLAHELGHNMGLQHDRETAARSNDTNSDGISLDPEEYGRYPYSFGYSTTTFYTIMSLRKTGQRGYPVFSNPNISSCGGVACGVADQEDNALALSQTMPVIAAFATPHTRNDFNGDGISDVLWRNNSNGFNAIWSSADANAPQPISGEPCMEDSGRW
jgi:hypothetical protein